MENHWLEKIRNRLEAESAQDRDKRFKRLQAQGMINDHGEVTGHLHRWSAYLAVTKQRRDASGKRIVNFRCFMPVFGMPGGATIDVCRDNMVDYLKQGKKIITAHLDDTLEMWNEGSVVHLSPKEFIRIDAGDEPTDDVGDLPEFHHVETRL
jgi:hypothetical protein